MQNSHISGILVLVSQDDNIKASLINEFGVSALDFVYYKGSEKIKINSMMKKIDKWYIRLVLKKDLRNVISAMQEDKTIYLNKKRNISYSFTPLCN